MWVTWWGAGLHLMSVGLYDGVLVIWWRVLGYIVGSVGLHGGECCVTWEMLDFMEENVGLPGDSPVREWPFNIRSRGGGGYLKTLVRQNYNLPLCTRKHAPPFPFDHVKYPPHPPAPSSSYFIYTQIQFFSKHRLFITFIKTLCQ